jgi:hypothetical protein
MYKADPLDHNNENNCCARLMYGDKEPSIKIISSVDSYFIGVLKEIREQKICRNGISVIRKMTSYVTRLNTKGSVHDLCSLTMQLG